HDLRNGFPGRLQPHRRHRLPQPLGLQQEPNQMTTIPTVAEAQRFTFTLKSLGGTPPAVLTQLLDLVDTVKNAPAASDPLSGIVDAAVAGRVGTAAEIAK